MIKVKRYANGVVAKLRNRTVAIFPQEDNDFIFEFKKVTNDLQPHAYHSVIKDKIVVTSIRLTEEATQALFIALSEYMRR